jgi:hypothetical protein
VESRIITLVYRLLRLNIDQLIMKNHSRWSFILQHLVIVLALGAPVGIASSSPIPMIAIALAPLVYIRGAERRVRNTYLLSVATSLLATSAALLVLFYLAIASFAKGR